MSGFEVVRRSFGRLAAHHLDVDVDRLVVRALRAATPGPCSALTVAGADAGLGREQRLDRASACFLFFATANLSDDLSDGDCDYLPPAAAQVVVLVLDRLWLDAVRDLALPADVELRVLEDLLAAQQAQVLEVSTSSWDAERLTAVTDGIAGKQWSAYLRIMWAGTPLEGLAPDVARHVGRAALLSGDIESADPRYTTLSTDDRRRVLRQAMASLEALDATDIPFTRLAVSQSRPVLAAEMARLPATGSPPPKRVITLDTA